MTVRTHIIGLDGRCARCNRAIPPLDKQGEVFLVGEHVGVIEGLRFTDSVSYRIGATDSNKDCQTTGKMPVGPTGETPAPQNASPART